MSSRYGRWRNVDRWPNAEARARVLEVFQRLHTLEPAGVGAEDLTPDEVPFLITCRRGA